MGAVVLEMDATPASHKRDEAVGHLLAASDSAYRLAFHVLGSSEAAEDVVQESYLEALDKLRAGLPAAKQRTWFLTTVVHRARDHRRGEARRRRREAAVAGERREAASPGGEEGRTAALRGVLAALDAKHRLPLVLCYQEEMTQREAAAVLQVPETTFSRHLREGLERLRSALRRAGYPAVAAAILGGLKETAPAVPASLAGRVEALVAQGAAARPAGAARRLAARRAAAKGGLSMKLVAGVVLTGAIAAGVAVVSGRGGGAKPLPAEEPKFPIPIWHPDARWSAKTEIDVGSGACGQLDGPRRETMSAWAIPARRVIGGPAAGPYGYLSYDPELGRIHFVAGSARGHLDGPFSRARLGSHSYSQVRRGAGSDRYVYCTEPQNKGILRRLDFVEQKVATVSVPAEVKGIAGMTCDSTGRLYIIGQYGGGLQILSPDGKVEKKAVEMKEGTGGFSGMSLVLDEKRNRLYASGYGSKKWYVYYWDLADGSFHGVLPIPQEGEPRRKRSEAGPFKGTDLYNQMGCSFGSDDPEKRFLYVYPNDTKTIFRLDLEKKEIWACDVRKDGVRFIPSGVPGRFSGWSAYFNMNGDLCTDVPFWNMPRTLRHPRIK